MVYVEDDTDFKEAVQNVVHREAFAASATGDFVLYLSSVQRYTLHVHQAHADLKINKLLTGGTAGQLDVKVSIAVDATLKQAQARYVEMCASWTLMSREPDANTQTNNHAC